MTLDRFGERDETWDRKAAEQDGEYIDGILWDWRKHMMAGIIVHVWVPRKTPLRDIFRVLDELSYTRNVVRWTYDFTD